MPELPEAETIVRGLRSVIVGQTIQRTEVVRADILRQTQRHFVSRVRDRSIDAVDRRAKNVLLRLDDGCVVVINLGMTGRLLPFARLPRGASRPGHPAVRFRFGSGAVLVFDDVRRFGTVECLTGDEWLARSERFGPEPLDDAYRPHHLHDALGQSRSPVRSWLLDQRRIAGVGNIYAAEALFLAGIHPQRPANTVRIREADALHAAVRDVLAEAIEAGGTTIRDYRNAEGEEGRYATSLHVYGRDGEHCHQCDDVIVRVVFANRSAFYCPTCQPRRTS